MNKAPLIIAGVAVLAVAAYMFVNKQQAEGGMDAAPEMAAPEAAPAPAPAPEAAPAPAPAPEAAPAVEGAAAPAPEAAPAPAAQ